MNRISFFKFFDRFKKGPSHQFLAAQLRKPSGFFARKVGDAMNKSNENLYDEAMKIMSLQADDIILEIGFGNGKMFPKIFAANNELSIYGLDYSKDMVRQAHKNNKAAVKAGKLKLHEGTSDHTPFPAHLFDKIFGINVIYFWDNPMEHLKEIQRILKSNGTFYAIIRDKEAMLAMPFTQYGFHIKETREWLDIFKNSGFTSVQIHTFDEPPLHFNGQLLQLKSHCMIASSPQKGE